MRRRLARPDCVLTDLMLDISSLVDIEMSADVGKDGIVIVDYNVVTVSYSLFNPVSI